MVFTSRSTTPASSGARPSGFGFIFVVLPIGGLLTQYTITGYDASAHLSEETQERGRHRGQGHVAVDLLLGHRRLDPPAGLPLRRPGRGQGDRGRRRRGHDLRPGPDLRSGAATVLLISTAGQFFCTMACMTSCSRMLFAFSRDGAVPGHKHWSRLERAAGAGGRGDPHRRDRHHPHRPGPDPAWTSTAPPVPMAFYAVVSIGVIGLYWCFAIPIWHRWRLGDKFQQGDWNLGTKYKWLCGHRPHRRGAGARSWPSCPRRTSASRGRTGFALKYVNYTIIVVPVAMIALWIYWHASVKKWFTGPRSTDRHDATRSWPRASEPAAPRLPRPSRPGLRPGRRASGGTDRAAARGRRSADAGAQGDA